MRKDHAGRAQVVGARTKALPDAKGIKGARKGILPAFLEPSLAQTTDRPPSGPTWVHEIKYDGYRTQARIDGGDVRLLTRKALDWTSRFPSIAVALKKLNLGSALIDGEIVVEDESGIPSFNLLQADLKTGRQQTGFAISCSIFFTSEGFDLRQGDAEGSARVAAADCRPGAVRLAALRFSGTAQDGPTMFRARLPARPGRHRVEADRSALSAGRGDRWLKSKSVLRQEFAILGYVPSTTTPGSIGALLLGYFRDGALHYAGRVGTGYSGEQAALLRKELDTIASAKPKLANRVPPESDKGLRWTQPKLVCEVEFRGWTADKLVRQAAFKGIREDRPAEEVVLETVPTPTKPDRGSELMRGRLTHRNRCSGRSRASPRRAWRILSRDRRLDPAAHLRTRAQPAALSVRRGRQMLFRQARLGRLSKAVRRVDVGEKESMLARRRGWADRSGAGGRRRDSSWGSTVANLEKPDRLIFDLDPGDGVPWGVVIEAARDVRDRLAALGLTSFVKTSGGKGLHVVLPIEPVVGWEEAKAFTQSFAETMATARPHRYIATMSKQARRGRVFIDYLRNGRGATAVAAYSTRAHATASVSTPLAWEELTESIRSDHFKIDNLRQRLAVLKDDPWRDFFSIRQRLPLAGKRR